MTDENLGTLGIKVPDLQTYDNSTLISYSADLDTQLFDLCSFTDSEKAYVIEVVENVRKRQ